MTSRLHLTRNPITADEQQFVQTLCKFQLLDTEFYEGNLALPEGGENFAICCEMDKHPSSNVIFLRVLRQQSQSRAGITEMSRLKRGFVRLCLRPIKHDRVRARVRPVVLKLPLSMQSCASGQATPLFLEGQMGFPVEGSSLPWKPVADHSWRARGIDHINSII